MAHLVDMHGNPIESAPREAYPEANYFADIYAWLHHHDYDVAMAPYFASMGAVSALLAEERRLFIMEAELAGGTSDGDITLVFASIEPAKSSLRKLFLQMAERAIGAVVELAEDKEEERMLRRRWWKFQNFTSSRQSQTNTYVYGFQRGETVVAGAFSYMQPKQVVAADDLLGKPLEEAVSLFAERGGLVFHYDIDTSLSHIAVMMVRQGLELLQGEEDAP